MHVTCASPATHLSTVSKQVHEGHLGHHLHAVTPTRGQVTLFQRAVTLHQDVSYQHWRGPREQHCPTVTLCLTINEVMMSDMSQVLPGHC